MSEALGRPVTPGPRFHDSEGTANTNVIGHNGQTLAIVEAGGQPVLLTDELETIERIDFNGTLDGSFSAHPKLDPVTGELHGGLPLDLGFHPLPRRQSRRHRHHEEGRCASRAQPDGA